MRNQNNTVMNIDDSEKGRKGIEEMLERMSNIKKNPTINSRLIKPKKKLRKI